MGPKMTACLASVLMVALGGCGTLVNCTNWKGTAHNEIYGGVKQDAKNGVYHLSEALHGPAPVFTAMPKPPDPVRDFAAKSFCAGCGVGMLALDLPVSMVTDTLTLPLTIPATLMKPDKKKPKHRSGAVGMPSAAMPAPRSSSP